jgi:hypothetical protein
VSWSGSRLQVEDKYENQSYSFESTRRVDEIRGRVIRTCGPGSKDPGFDRVPVLTDHFIATYSTSSARPVYQRNACVFIERQTMKLTVYLIRHSWLAFRHYNIVFCVLSELAFVHPNVPTPLPNSSFGLKVSSPISTSSRSNIPASWKKDAVVRNNDHVVEQDFRI